MLFPRAEKHNTSLFLSFHFFCTWSSRNQWSESYRRSLAVLNMARVEYGTKPLVPGLLSPDIFGMVPFVCFNISIPNFFSTYRMPLVDSGLPDCDAEIHLAGQSLVVRQWPISWPMVATSTGWYLLDLHISKAGRHSRHLQWHRPLYPAAL